MKLLINEIVESIIICHDFIREKYDRSSVSLRDIGIFGFLNILKNILKWLMYTINKFYKDSLLSIQEKQITNIAKQMAYEKEKGISLNRALTENLFTCFISIVNNAPLIIIGKPGTGKSLSFQILYNSLKGKHSESKLYRDIEKLFRFYYQGSEISTSEGIEKFFKKANKSIKEQNLILINISKKVP